MAQDWAVHFYRSVQWRANRKRYMEKPLDSPWGIIPPGMCERCYSEGKLVPAKVVHHKTHLNPNNIDDPHVTLSFDNFMRLCQDCHAFVHGGTEPIRCSFDEYGNVIPKQTGVTIDG